MYTLTCFYMLLQPPEHRGYKIHLNIHFFVNFFVNSIHSIPKDILEQLFKFNNNKLILNLERPLYVILKHIYNKS